MDFIIIIALFLLLIGGAILSFRYGGLNWIYVYVAAAAGAMFTMSFMQINFLGQILLISEVIFAAYFLITDVIEEHYGKKSARKVIPIVIGTWLFIWALASLATLLSPTEGDVFFEPLSKILEVYTPFTMALLAGIFFFLQYVDTHFYELIRKKSKGKYLWLRNIGSTFITQSLDLVVSYLILVPIIFPEMSWVELSSLIIAAAAFKYSMVIVDTPFVYLSYKFRPKELLEKEIST